MKRTIMIFFLLLLAGRSFAAAPASVGGNGQIGVSARQLKPADFSYIAFEAADFRQAAFDTAADFTRAAFSGDADFFAARFNSYAYFWRAAFAGKASFRRAQFDSAAHFVGCTFNGGADFGQATFRRSVDYRGATFNGSADFGQTTFCGAIDLRGAAFAAAYFVDAVFPDDRADFTFAVMKSDLIIGSSMRRVQTYDFTDAVFSAKGRIVIVNRVKLHIPPEKMKIVRIADHLDYYSKKNLIEFIKESSFAPEKYARERLELDYIYAKSAMYQDKVFGESENKLHQVWKWPHWGSSLLYELSMGLGYRPFRLVFWLLGVILFYSIFYSLTMADDVAKFIRQQAGTDDRAVAPSEDLASSVATWMNGLYFSASVLLSCRVQKYVQSRFSTRGKMVVFSEWLLCLIILVSFVTLTKPGALFNALSRLSFR